MTRHGTRVDIGRRRPPQPDDIANDVTARQRHGKHTARSIPIRAGKPEPTADPLAVDQPSVGRHKDETAIVTRSRRRQLNRLRVAERQPLHGCDVDSTDGCERSAAPVAISRAYP